MISLNLEVCQILLLVMTVFHSVCVIPGFSMVRNGDSLFDDDNDDYVDDDHDADDGGRSTFNWGVWQPSYDRF